MRNRSAPWRATSETDTGTPSCMPSGMLNCIQCEAQIPINRQQLTIVPQWHDQLQSSFSRHIPGKTQTVQRLTEVKMLLPGSFPEQQLPCAALVENQELLGSQGFHHPTARIHVGERSPKHSHVNGYLPFCPSV